VEKSPLKYTYILAACLFSCHLVCHSSYNYKVYC